MFYINFEINFFELFPAQVLKTLQLNKVILLSLHTIWSFEFLDFNMLCSLYSLYYNHLYSYILTFIQFIFHVFNKHI